MKKGDIARTRIIATALARHYGYQIGYDGACACTGLSGTCLDCPSWWVMFLEKYDKRTVEKMHGAYLLFCG